MTVPIPSHLQAGLLVLVALGLYALFGGADFGGGIWDLFASGPSAARQRGAIARAMGPVWEVNHVWLIFALVVAFTAFPSGFSTITVALFWPLHLALAGLILRGAAFALRPAPEAQVGGRRGAWSWVFGVASLLTPLLMGMTVGLLTPGEGGTPLVADRPLGSAGWWSPLSLGVGLLAAATSAYVAAVFMTLETGGELQALFRRRALASAGVVAGLTLMSLGSLAEAAPALADRLFAPPALPVTAGGLVAAVLAATSLWRRDYPAARVLAALQVAGMVGSFALARGPYVVYPTLSLQEAAAPAGVVSTVIGISLPGLALLVPALGLLWAVFKSPRTPAHPAEGTTARRPS
ncbi:cytochrome d ubiquinol oxidase subunit II [Carboxydochorda subterranea]|uniref:Cytochrome d ubiquinol oxidase subunit II n=1 Tax=Carboxydichorda subterranea TaxID=3109565 RepID=A0ABZ1BXA5_9FIRM|nr:cytochrome d ubiquinol oxidase subunit II [Limnochorda sp. L945t]WRP17250.1 cytochrome d ubiquinol oxidase subunit II [Limnochorda sp. L945t]